MKICVLGSSHAACLKGAWDVVGNRPPDHALTFFAAFWMSLKNLELDGHRLVPSTKTLRRTLAYTAGQGEIDIPAYDAFLICGLEIALLPIDRRVSRQVLRALSSDLVKPSLAYSLANKIRQVSDAPIHVMHPPLLDERTAAEVGFDVVTYDDYFPLMEQALDIPGAHLLKQPDETVTRGHFTRLEFSKDAVRLAVSGVTENMQHLEDDYSHMNAAYGAVRLRDFFGRLARRPSLPL